MGVLLIPPAKTRGNSSLSESNGTNRGGGRDILRRRGTLHKVLNKFNSI